ncbi:uncharacterized protein EV422DRAFT_34166 [Fimicolochytrium jonesii]|uniref:uncharacterized protein n=1 Tax=Fimicolochytrium jonesii TaxID=1396493 RepID=UPI0022FE5246|nr:uncharacterized protein EV422DRAFT_34166 [Fimicolochytrium jonesii]KAI8827271.1 hypothetical protein EV422DRAFT_34166 [Fimicolochytrium jonesii]
MPTTMSTLMSTLRCVNFGPFKDKTIHFEGPVTTLVGSNRSGKTNLLKAVTIVAYLLYHASDENGVLHSTAVLNVEELSVLRKLSLNDDFGSLFRQGENFDRFEARFTNGAAVDLSLTRGPSGQGGTLTINHHDTSIKVPDIRCTLIPRDLTLCYSSEERIRGNQDKIRAQLSGRLVPGSGRSFYTSNLVHYLQQTTLTSLFSSIAS